MPSLLDLAVTNNALWCDAVSRANGIPGEIRPHLWLNRNVVPRYYSNLISLTAAPGVAFQTEAIQDLIQAGQLGAWSVKDSFTALDLSSLGFGVLFEATWLFRSAGLPPPAEMIAGVRWERIQDEASLAGWERAWDAVGPNEAKPRVFPPAILKEDGVVFLGAYREGKVVAGAIGNRTGDVVGLSNVFTPEADAALWWGGCVAAVMKAFPGLPLVGYERGTDLETAHRFGFTDLGPLRVWTRQALT